MTKVKICGLMKKEHIKVAVDYKADAIGFVFAPSKRRISMEEAHVLAKGVGENVLKVGVFVNETAEKMIEIARFVPLDVIQLHGEEQNEMIEQLQGFLTIKAFSIRTKEDVIAADQCRANYLLFDAPGTDFKGGSGNRFDWSLLDALHIDKERIILAGGLNKDNIQEAINQVNPFYVDVSSGVETNGQKDEKKIIEFLATVKNGEAHI